MLSYEQFKNEVVESIHSFLSEEFATAKVSLKQVLKNNDTKLDGLTIERKDYNIAPTVYLNDYYKLYQNGMSLDLVMGKIASAVEQHSPNQNFDISWIMDYSKAKEKIIPRLVNEENNAERLSSLPYTNMHDLAVIYVVEFTDSADGIAGVTVSSDMMRCWDISLEELNETAVANLERRTDSALIGMRDILIDTMTTEMMEKGMDRIEAEKYVDTILPTVLPGEPEEAIPMYVITNGTKTNGANVLLDKNFMDTVADRLGGDFWILPSSVHECICVPKNNMNVDYGVLEAMVKDANATVVAPEDILSNHVYEYNSLAHELSRCDVEQMQPIQRHRKTR